MKILKKIWNTTFTVGQVVIGALVALFIGFILWLLVQMFRPKS